MTTIKELATEINGRVYVYLADKETGSRFLKDAENEGFTFCDGVKPTEREMDSIYALNKDMTINYVGFVGHMAYRYADAIAGVPLVKVDYREFLKQSE